MIVLLMGVSGAGKTAVGQRLAERHGLDFIDADDLHSAENVCKMAAGTPLSDEDRRPWLEALRRAIEEPVAAGASAVVACSALKASYRRQLLEGIPDATLVYLRGSRELLSERVALRSDHFFDPSLLDSQIETLEEPGDEALVVDVDPPLLLVVEAVERVTGLVST